MDWAMYDLHTTLAHTPNAWLRDENGNLVTIVGQNVFEFTVPEVPTSV